MKALGIDVSHHRPVKDWTLLDANVCKFIGVKASEGPSFIDPTLRAHRAGFRSSGMHLGVYYHFARSGDPKAQAERLMDVVGELRPNERLCLDLEVMVAPKPKAALLWVDMFYVTLMKGLCNDRRPLIYTSKRIWREVCGDLDWDLAEEIDLWVPRYNFDPRVGHSLEPEVPRPWVGRQWKFWQWTDGGEHGPEFSIPGVGPCDADFFQGDATALAEYVKGSVKTKPELVA